MSTLDQAFVQAYEALNQQQRQAVDALDGPVMVIAGPGTGKTQVLALRIANILKQTDTPANGILALTFTRAGVQAMRERLLTYIGSRAREVTIATFHRFALDLIAKHYALLGFETAPSILDDQQKIALADELLETREWQHIRPRGDGARYFSDLQQLISLMKREAVSPEAFMASIDADTAELRADPGSISSRGETKGQLKKEVQTKIDGLERTREVVTFYTAYETIKRERALLDYDDALEYAVQLVQQFDDVAADIRENYQYVLVDEHQDSSGVQNAFLTAVWKDVERPDLFVVGDDRQLIYGFGGAKQSYFESFKTAFGAATVISLVENYRSTTPILAVADTLLTSSLTTDQLRSNRNGNDPVVLAAYAYERDEIIAAGLSFRDAIAAGTPPHECALLVPRNRQVRAAVQVLRSLGLPIRSQGSVSLFSLPDADFFRAVLRVIADPYDGVALAQTLFHPLAGIPPLAAHAFLRTLKRDQLSVPALLAADATNTLFTGQHPVAHWGARLTAWMDVAAHEGVDPLMHRVGTELLIDTAPDHETLLRRVEMVRTMVQLVHGRTAVQPKTTLADFLQYLDRLETYGQEVPVATLLGGEGVQVLTLHGSKGLEFDRVWVAHLNESTLLAQKRLGFTVPTKIQELIEARDRAVATREVYVAITRARLHCTISYAQRATTDAELELAQLIADLPQGLFIHQTVTETEAALVARDPKLYVVPQAPIAPIGAVDALLATVRDEYADRAVSVTLLNNFFECPWKWYFRNLLQLPEAKAEQLVFGSAVHSAVEQLLKETIKPTPAAITEAIAAALTRDGIVAPVAIRRLAAQGSEAVLRWATAALPHLAADHQSERPLSYKDTQYPHLTMFGKIDLTEHFPDGTITVTDFKTGSTKTAGAIEKLDDEGRLSGSLRQLAMYAYLIRGAEKKEVTTAQLLYIEAAPGEKNARYATRITDEQIDLLRRDIGDYDTALREGTWIHRDCHHQSFGTAEPCPYCALAKTIYGV